MFLYLSHPIDLAEPEIMLAVRNIKDGLRQYLHDHNSDVVLFQPMESFYVSPGAVPGPAIEMVNQTAQKQAQGLIVIWPHNSKSWGVPVEIERAIQNNQPVAFITNSKTTWAHPRAWLDSDLFQTFHLEDPDTVTNAVVWLELMAEYHNNANNQLPVKLLNDNATMPTKAYSDDAGFDLYVSEETTIQPGSFVDVPCAVAVQMPSNTWALLTGRSSTLRKHGLMVNQGIIDPGYRGELYAGVFNLGNKAITISKGDRLAQLILMPNHALNTTLYQTNELAQHQRGQAGFGSSGR
jgi:dUTP pyrophosphatase